MNEYLIGFIFIVQAGAIIFSLWVGVKVGKGEPIVSQKEKMLDLPTVPPEEESGFEVDEPVLTWEPRMTERAEEQ